MLNVFWVHGKGGTLPAWQVRAAFDFHAGHNTRSFSPREKARMRGKGVSNGQAAICSLRTHCLGFAHYKR
jgi:hypothetical protein